MCFSDSDIPLTRIYLINLPGYMNIFIANNQKPSKDTTTGKWLHKQLRPTYSRSVRRNEEYSVSQFGKMPRIYG